MYHLTEYMLYHMFLHVGKIYCKGVVIFNIIWFECVSYLLLPALMFLSISIWDSEIKQQYFSSAHKLTLPI